MTDHNEPRRADPETFLENFREGSELIGFGTPPPELERMLVEALDRGNELAAHPYRWLPRRRGALVAFLRGVVSALAEDGITDLWRYQDDDPNARTVRRWWNRGYYWTNTITRGRYRIYTCSGCRRRVHNPNTPEHDPACHVHPNNYRPIWAWEREPVQRKRTKP